MAHHHTAYAFRRTALAFVVLASVVAVGLGTSPQATAAPTNCDRGTNLSFETPAISGSWTTTAAPGWEATDTVEIWRDPFGPGAVDGLQITELKANDGTPLWQDIATLGGDRLAWSFSHRGRSGTDTVDVLIGSTTSQTTEGTYSDGTSAWVRHGDTYTVPAAQTTTRFVLDPQGGGSVGNLVDHVLFDLTCEISIGTSVGSVSDPDGSGDVSLGDVITFLYDLENLGTATLATIGVVEALGDPVACPDTQLAPTETTQCSATHVITQADVDAGSVAASGEASGTDAAGVTVNDTDGASVDVPQVATVSLSTSAMVDNAVVAPPTRTDVGDTVNHEYVVTNTGNVTLTNIVVTDPTIGAVTCSPTTLAPSESVTCTASFIVTQDTIDAANVTSSADVVGTPPLGDNAVASDTLDTAITQLPDLEVTKASVEPEYDTAGQTLDYTITVTNTGNATIGEITVADTNADDGSIACGATLPATLAPGATLVCSALHTVTQADIDGGSVDNSASASGTDPTDAPVDGTSATVTINADQQPSIDLVKTGAVDTSITSPSNRVDAGDAIDYTFDATNTGNVTITAYTVSDPFLGPLTCDTAPIAPGETVQCEGSHTITQENIDTGLVTNTAGVSSTTPGGPASDTATWDQPLEQVSNLTIDKSSTVTPVGDGTFVFVYTIALANAGNTTIVDLQVVDDLVAVFGGVGYTVDSVAGLNVTVNPGFDGSADTNLLTGDDDLAPGSAATVSIRLTAAPEGAPGPYTNGATATAVAGAGTVVAEDADDVTLDVSYDLSLAMSGLSSVAEGGNHEWDMTIANSGPSVATGPITVATILDEDLTFVSATGQGWECTAAAGTVTCVHAEDLVAGAESPLVLVSTVDAPAGTTITNVASVASVDASNDSNPANNNAGSSVLVDALPVTGLDSATIAMIGIAQLMLGFVLLALSRRRKRTTTIA